MQALRMGRWKAVRPAPGAGVEIYDLACDPGETTDLAARMPEMRRQAEEAMAQARTMPRPQREPVSEWVIPRPRAVSPAKQ